MQDAFLSETQPFCFFLDADLTVASTWGPGEWCGLGSLNIGDKATDAASFLVGADLSVSQRFEFLEIAEGAVAHAIFIPKDDGCYVLLLDAREQREAIRSRQQSVNELKLMHARQRAFIARQRELIGDLVETRSELDHHRREAERASANKSRFIAMMSHEFRTPLASIINYADLAAENGATVNDVQRSVETIARSARHLTSLVEAVLDDASLDAGRTELSESDFSLVGLLDDVASMMAPLAAEKGLSFATRLDANVPDYIRADGIRLRQVLINLLGNAVKFTTEGSVELLATYVDGRLVVSVSDTGPGISLSDQERVFQAFERGGQQNESGAGLGLTITLRLVKLMAGEVTLDSSPGEGCTVAVNLPVAVQSASTQRQLEILPLPPRETVAEKPASILVCDDDEDMIALLEHYLQRAGYGLTATNDSSAAIAKALKFDPDLIIMDCNLPGIGGVAATRLLRQQGYDRPILALTASKLNADDIEVFTHYFRKPVSMPELLTLIKDALDPGPQTHASPSQVG